MAEEAHNEEEAKLLIARIGKKLAASKTCPNKDTLVKLLKQATGAFPVLKQSESLKLTVELLSESLVRHGLLHHRDKDVRLLVGICIVEVVRVVAPNPDFSDTVLKDIYALLLSIFGELGDVASPYFPKRVKLLETIAKLKFCVLMLEIGCEDLILKMFKSFFSVVRDNHPPSLINSMSFIITCILEEKAKEVDSDPFCHANASQTLLDVILQNIIKEKKAGASASFQLAVSVIQKCGERLKDRMCEFLESCILNRDAVRSVVKEHYHAIILEIFQIAPHILLTIIPNLKQELLTDQVDVRIKALALIKKLLALPGQNVAWEYRKVFIEFLNRFSDKSAEVRIAALSCAKAFYTTNQSEKESLEVLSAIQGRLLDQDDKVRAEAVNVVCEVAKSYVKYASSDLIFQAAERLRDKKVLVRSKALKKLVELYQEYCRRYAAGLTLLNEHIEGIPCKILMLCYEKDCKEFRPQSMELVLADLFPGSVSTQERTRHWIFMFSLFKQPHLKALKIILSQKRRLQDGLRYYLDIWNRNEENGSEEAERKLESLIMRMSSNFPDPSKAKDCFQKLYKIKDNGIYSALQQSLDKETAICSETIKGFCLREFGDQNAVSEFFHLLFTKCSFNIFSSEHIHCILDCLSGDEESIHLKNSAVKLLFTIIGAFPSCLRGSEKLFQRLILEKVIPFDDQLIEILAQEGRRLSIELSYVYSPLETMCLEGTRLQAKLAVSAVAALADTSEHHILAKLCEALVDSLCNGQNAPTVLQSLGCLAQHSVSTFEAREAVIRRYIAEEIFQQNHAPCSEDLDFGGETSECCSSCKLKVFGLKAFVRSFLPHKQTSISRPISFLLDIILQMLQNDGAFCGDIMCKRKKACIRLAAAKSVLRLTRKWDLHISPQVFHLTVLVAKDQSPWVRRSFATKLHKFLRNQFIPSRYACAFSFGALDSLKDLRDDALNYLEEFISGYGKGAQRHETMAVQGVANHPVNIVVFLIHVLAHNTNFPSPDCQDEKVYAQFLSPLFVTLEALVNEKLGASKTRNASSYLLSILKAIQRTEDAVDAQMSSKLHLLAEMGISILRSLNSNNTPVANTNGLILLPSSLYKSGSAEIRGANTYSFIGHKADANFTKKLVSSLKTEVSGTGSTSTNSSRQFNENPSRASDTTERGSNPKYSKGDNLLINKTAEQFDQLNTGLDEQDGILNLDVNTRGRLDQVESSHHGSAGSHNEFCADNELERDAYRNSDAKLSLSFDSVATKSLLPQDKVTVNSSRVKDTVSRCTSLCAEPSKSSRTCDQGNVCRYKGLGDLRPLYCDDNSDCSANGQRKIHVLFGFDSQQEKAPKDRELRLRKVPQAVKKNKRSIDATDTSMSEVTDVNGNALPRRSQRRKV